ncbi:MAG: hypothetical protein J2P41_14110 [Blastocatellia bacterium]|nr:hypothetical protein [Blastocatellia bacterium]
MKRLLLTLAVIALFCLATLSFKGMLGSTSAQNTNNESVILPLLVPGNNLGIRLRSMSNDGNRILFESTSNVFGGNGENNFEIYVYDKTTLSVTEITNTQNFNDPSGAQVNVGNILGVISGDGTRIAFVSNAQSLDPANPNNDGNYEIHIVDWPIGGTPGPIRRITDTGNEFGGDNQRNVFSNSDLAISDDGDTIAFITTRNVFNAINGFQALTIDNPDRDAEVMVCRVSTGQYTQVTHSNPMARPNPNLPGGTNVRPKLSGDGTVLAWLSDFDYANVNSDQNAEIFVTQVGSGNIRQITQTTAPLPGFAGAVVPVLNPDTGIYSIDLGAPINVWAPDTKPLDATGTNIVFESSANLDGNNPNLARQVYLYNSTSNSFRMITNQTISSAPSQAELAVIDYNFSPSINSQGTFVSFCSSRNFVPTDPSDVTKDNGDGSKEIFRFDLGSGTFRQLTFTSTSLSFTDQRTNVSPSFLNAGGDTVTFDYEAPSILPNATNVIDLFQSTIRPITSANNSGIAIGNAASFNTDQVARGSVAVALNAPIADAPPTTIHPFILNGVSVTIGGVAAQIISISGGRIVFLLPNGIGDNGTTPFSINDNGVQYTGTSNVVDSSPGLFSVDGTGTGPLIARCLSKFVNGPDVYSDPPCAASTDNMTSILFAFGTGWRNAAGGIQIKINDQTLDPIYAGPEGGNGSLRDQFNVIIPSALSGVTNADISVVLTSNSFESNKTKISFQGGPTQLAVNDDGTGLVCLVKSIGLPDVYVPPPCPVSNSSTTSILVIGGFGWRNAASTQVLIDNDVLTPIYSGVNGANLALDQINVVVPPSLLGRTGSLSVIIPGTNVQSNSVSVSFLGDPTALTVNPTSAGTCLVKTPGQPDVYMPPPCPVSNGDTVSILVIAGTGWRYASNLQVQIDTDLFTPIYYGPQFNGMTDQINILIPPSLAGRTSQLSVLIPGTTVVSNSVAISFLPGP